LFLRRAEAVKNMFVGKYGVGGARTGTKGWGDDQPLVANDTEEGRPLNRCAEVLIAH